VVGPGIAIVVVVIVVIVIVVAAATVIICVNELPQAKARKSTKTEATGTEEAKKQPSPTS
jgi:flagellar basal body-associated protein FliL